MSAPTHAYVTIRGSRSHRQVHRDASPASSTSPSPFAALVLGHPDGTSTRFELSYRPDATLRDGSEGALVDLTLVSPLAESLTLCRVLVPADGKSEPVPSYPATQPPWTPVGATAEGAQRHGGTHHCFHGQGWSDGFDLWEDGTGLCSTRDGRTCCSFFEGEFEDKAAALAALEWVRRHPANQPTIATADRHLYNAPALSTADPAESFTGSPEPTGTASAAEAFEGRRS